MYPDSINAINDPSGALVSESVMVADIHLPLSNTIGGLYLPRAFVQAPTVTVSPFSDGVMELTTFPPFQLPQHQS